MSYADIWRKKDALYKQATGVFDQLARDGKSQVPKFPRATWKSENAWWLNEAARAQAAAGSRPHEGNELGTKLAQLYDTVARIYMDPADPLSFKHAEEWWWWNIPRLAREMDAVVNSPTKWDIFGEALKETLGDIGDSISDAGKSVFGGPLKYIAIAAGAVIGLAIVVAVIRK